MTSRPVARVRGAFYSAFYRLPGRWRRRLVRVASAKYIVGGVVLVRDADAAAPARLVLLRQPPGYGWSLPAGLLKKGEPPVVGAARELLEETGIRVSPGELTPADPAAVVHHRGRWVDVVFEARVPAEVAFAVDGAEVFEAAWHRLDALPPLTPPTARLLAHYGIGPYVGYPEATDGADE
jgi:8-oxo-dGTP pyrophosphatase MutT (NUDIX family)